MATKAKPDTQPDPSGEIAVTTATLASINNIDDALEYVRSQGDVVVASEMGDNDGYEFVQDKGRLVGTRMVLVGVSSLDSPRFGEGVTVRFISAGGFKGKFIDFSTGIKEQLFALFEQNPNIAGVVCEHGLVESTYGPKLDDDGREIRPGGTTFYLDTAPSSSGHIS